MHSGKGYGKVWLDICHASSLQVALICNEGRKEKGHHLKQINIKQKRVYHVKFEVVGKKKIAL